MFGLGALAAHLFIAPEDRSREFSTGGRSQEDYLALGGIFAGSFLFVALYNCTSTTGEPLDVSRLNLPGQSGQVIRSTLDGEFRGYRYGTLFPLLNGQVWRQESYVISAHALARPQVQIITVNNEYYLTVEGAPSSVRVVRVR